MRKTTAVAIPLLMACAALAGCVAPVGPIEVTRFHVPDAQRLGHGDIVVAPAIGQDPQHPEWRSFASAVGRQLVMTGYAEKAPGTRTPQIAQVAVTREAWRSGQARSPVSIGIGGGTGGYGSGVGLGVGIDLSGPPPEQVSTQLSVRIIDAASGQALWEGRARHTLRASSPLADTQLGAAKLAEALFKGFPGVSGETIEVR